jgi:1-acyl-sn-glycerol-3-phosphate acyltransferase
MNDSHSDSPATPDPVSMFDPESAAKLMSVAKPVTKRWHRSEVHGLDSFPEVGALVVSNHSGGMIAVDVPVFAVDFYERFGYSRPVFTLTHDLMFRTPAGDFLRRAGFIPANRRNAAAALQSGGVVIVFPGGDYDAYRPTTVANKIDFNGRTGYVRTALEAGTPIVPVVSIGGQENQLYLSRGGRLARMLGLDKLIRSDILPVSVGVPFGVSVLLPLNVPLPSKIVSRVLEPIDLAQFGTDPAVDEIDAHVRRVMQHALDQLAEQRRFPILG